MTAETHRPRKFWEWNDKVFAVMNWKGRTKRHAVILSRQLGPDELTDYQKQKASGASDTTIFGNLFPSINPMTGFGTPNKSEMDSNKKSEVQVKLMREALPIKANTVRVPVDILTEDQLVRLIEDRLGTSLPNLKELTRRELASLLLGMGK